MSVVVLQTLLVVSCAPSPAGPTPPSGSLGTVTPAGARPQATLQPTATPEHATATVAGAPAPVTRTSVAVTPRPAEHTLLFRFDRLSFPEDYEGLETQIGPLRGVTGLSIGGDDTATVRYDPSLTECNQIVAVVRTLGFLVRSHECPPSPEDASPDGVTAAAPPLRVETLTVGVTLDTYEAEETVQYELGRLPGILSLVVTQNEVMAQYEPTRLTEEEVLNVLRANPEVRIREDPHAGH